MRNLRILTALSIISTQIGELTAWDLAENFDVEQILRAIIKADPRERLIYRFLDQSGKITSPNKAMTVIR